MPNPEIRQIEPIWQNAWRVVELTREVYKRSGNYSNEQLNKIASLVDTDSVNTRLLRLRSQGEPPLLQRYDGLYENNELQGFLLSAVWDKEDQEPFSNGVDDPSEYYTDKNQVFGSHIIAITAGALGHGYGKQLFDQMIRRHPDSTIKSAVDERDELLKEYMVNVRGMTNTGLLGAVALGDSGIESTHRLFKARVNSNGIISPS